MLNLEIMRRQAQCSRANEVDQAGREGQFLFCVWDEERSEGHAELYALTLRYTPHVKGLLAAANEDR
jgi:hypothetical protein